jgi:CubicO group peptidase (beta-lactamase class C family)
VSKVVAATALHVLIAQSRGSVSYDTRVAEFWPEFGANGKHSTTLRHILTHASGLQHAFPEAATLDDFCSWTGMMAVIEQATPVWPPGSRSGKNTVHFNSSFVKIKLFQRYCSAVP